MKLFLLLFLATILLAKDNFVYDPKDVKVDPRVYNNTINLQAKVKKLEKHLKHHRHESKQGQTLTMIQKNRAEIKRLQQVLANNSDYKVATLDPIMQSDSFSMQSNYATKKELNRFLLEIDDLHESILKLKAKLKHNNQPMLTPKMGKLDDMIQKYLSFILIASFVLIIILFIMLISLSNKVISLKRKLYQPNKRKSEEIK
jgi:hypothetical protein